MPWDLKQCFLLALSHLESPFAQRSVRGPCISLGKIFCKAGCALINFLNRTREEKSVPMYIDVVHASSSSGKISIH